MRAAADVAAYASGESNRITILVWHYHDDDVPGAAAAVTLKIEGWSSPKKEFKTKHYRIDDEHSNAYAAWLKMGAPLPLTAAQQIRLEQAGQLTELENFEQLKVSGETAELNFILPRQAVSLLVISTE